MTLFYIVQMLCVYANAMHIHFIPVHVHIYTCMGQFPYNNKYLSFCSKHETVYSAAEIYMCSVRQVKYQLSWVIQMLTHQRKFNNICIKWVS